MPGGRGSTGIGARPSRGMRSGLGGVVPRMDFMAQTIAEFRSHHGVVREPMNFGDQ
ncbi:hypothetical protein [Ruania albidiflava]|uniref:hypothetical protein n=1 Tax=Ruania albidiflava TaxID=366586 RepID=UPI0023F537D3|nr:hypothetical protein [Ruania albidiflava]